MSSEEMSEVKKLDKALLTVPELCRYLNIGDTKARQLLKDPRCTFRVRIGNRLYAHKAKLDKWLDLQCS